MERKMQMAQANLLARASVLQLCGVKESVYTNCHPYNGMMSFHFGNIELSFDDEHPYSESEVEETIKALDAKIEDQAKRANKTLEVIKAWRG
jgi:hypothetical protein